TRRRAGRPGRGTSWPRVEQRPGPSAALESAAAVLIRPAESLHHSVDGDVRDGRQFHGRSSLLAEFVVVRFDRTGAPISSVAAESVRPIHSAPSPNKAQGDNARKLPGTNPGAERLILFHIVASGRCWVSRADGERYWAGAG